jgi:3-deoxy-D-manno-octulosonate 8-phosphate phosphatase (KDO 8-P phosphatase)
LLDDISAFVFDFDGVLTNNLVYINQKGHESIRCSRADGLAFDVLHKLKKRVYILSTEENPVVSARATKLNVTVFQGISNKVEGLSKLVEQNFLDLQSVLYVGNDLNDYHAMNLCGYTACPADSHHAIKKISKIQLSANGGNGVIRELLEDVLGLDFLSILN